LTYAIEQAEQANEAAQEHNACAVPVGNGEMMDTPKTPQMLKEDRDRAIGNAWNDAVNRYCASPYWKRSYTYNTNPHKE